MPPVSALLAFQAHQNQEVMAACMPSTAGPVFWMYSLKSLRHCATASVPALVLQFTVGIHHHGKHDGGHENFAKYHYSASSL